MRPRRRPHREHRTVQLPIWSELLAPVELGFLWMSPVFRGYGIPHGDGAAVVVVPGFLGTDLYLGQFRSWLRRIGYRPYYSGIRMNAECPNLLIRLNLAAAIDKAWKSTKRKIHIIGHSLGGTMARSVAAQMPDRIASVISVAAPIRGFAAHAAVVRTADLVRKQILERHGRKVLPECYTAQCTCNFIESLMGKFPTSVRQTAIFSKCDGIMDWHVCRTGDPSVDFEVSATHMGAVFSPLVYRIVAERLSGL